MKSILSVILLILMATSHVGAQDSTNTKPPKWNLYWVGSLNGSQAAYSNWSQGGVNSIALTGATTFKGVYSSGRYKYTTQTVLRYGQTRIENEEVRKTDDIIQFVNKIEMLLDNPTYSFFADVNFRTQFDRGFDNDNVTVISDFFAPAFVQENLGFSYQPSSFWNLEIGLALKQTIVADTLYSTNFGVQQGEHFRSEGGLGIGVNAKKEIAKNVMYIGSLNTFTNFLIPVSSTDVFWTNELSGKINDFLNANVQFALVYDDDFSKQAQIKQVIAVGFSYRFL